MTVSGVRAPVWDVPTRVVHWLLVALIAFSWWSAENDRMDWHRLSGYAVLTLLVFRLYWGFAGSSTSRFSDFVRGPAEFVRYARALFERRGEISPGHNPMGGWSVLLLLGLLLLQTGTGLFSVDVDGIESGPLSRWIGFGLGRDIAELHELSFNLLLAAAGLHIAAVLFYLVYKRENLVSAMLSGYKRLPGPPQRPYVPAPWWRAVLGLAAAAALTWLIATGFSFG